MGRAVTYEWTPSDYELERTIDSVLNSPKATPNEKVLASVARQLLSRIDDCRGDFDELGEELEEVRCEVDPLVTKHERELEDQQLKILLDGDVVGFPETNS